MFPPLLKSSLDLPGTVLSSSLRDLFDQLFFFLNLFSKHFEHLLCAGPMLGSGDK